MVNYADAYVGAGEFTGEGPAGPIALSLADIESVESGLWVSGLVVFVPSVDTSACLVELTRTGPTQRTIASVPIVLAAPITDPYTLVVPIAGMDGPGIAPDAGYQLLLTCTDASGETTYSSASLHVRYNMPIPVQLAG